MPYLLGVLEASVIRPQESETGPARSHETALKKFLSVSELALAREREPIERARARLEALVRANAAPRCGARSSGQASLAERQRCPTAGARFTAARVLGRGRQRA